MESLCEYSFSSIRVWWYLSKGCLRWHHFLLRSHHQCHSLLSLSCVSFGPRLVETFDLLQIPVACFCAPAPRTATIYIWGGCSAPHKILSFSRYHFLHPGYWYLVPAAVTARSHLSVESHFFLLSCTLQHPPDTSMPPNASPHPSLPVVRAPDLATLTFNLY